MKLGIEEQMKILEQDLQAKQKLLELLKEKNDPRAAGIEHAVTELAAKLNALRTGTPIPEETAFKLKASEQLTGSIIEDRVRRITDTLNASALMKDEQKSEKFNNFLEEITESDKLRLESFNNGVESYGSKTFVKSDGRTYQVFSEYLHAVDALRVGDVSKLNDLLKYPEAGALLQHLESNLNFISELSKIYQEEYSDSLDNIDSRDSDMGEELNLDDIPDLSGFGESNPQSKTPPLLDEEERQRQERAEQAQREVEQTREKALTSMGIDPTRETASPAETLEGKALTAKARDLLEENKKIDEKKDIDEKQRTKEKHELLKKMKGVAKPILAAKKKFAAQDGDKKQTLGEILADETKLPTKGDIEDSIEALLNNLIAGFVALQKYYSESNKSEAEEKPLQSTTDTITRSDPDKSDKKATEPTVSSVDTVVTPPEQAQEHPPGEEPKPKPKIVAELGPVAQGGVISPKTQEFLEKAKDSATAIQGMTDVMDISNNLDELRSIQLQMQQDPSFVQSSVHQPPSEGTGIDLGLGLKLEGVKKVVAGTEELFTVKPQQIPTDEQEDLFTMEQGSPTPKEEDVVDAALSVTAHPKNREDDKVELTASQTAALKARSKLLDEKHLDFKDPMQMLKDDEYEVYKKQYGDDFFKKLAATIVERSDAVKDPSALNPKHKIQHRHAQRTLDIGNAVKFAEWGARRELMEAKNDTAVFKQHQDAKAAYEKINDEYRGAEQAVAKSTDQIEVIKAQQKDLDPASENHDTKKADLEAALDKATKELAENQKALDKIKPEFEAKENAYKRSDYTQALARVEVAEKIRHTFESLHALSKYRSRYTEDNYNQRMNELRQLMQRHDLSDDNKKLVQQAVQHAQENYNFHKTKMYKPPGWRSSRFDSTKDNFSLSDKKYKKDLKIEHYTEPNGSKTVQVTFSFNRENMSGESRSRFNPAGHNYAYGQMKRQVSHMLDIAIGEYNKGSPENPIHIRYGKSKSGKQLAQPDIALGIMMELKKRAVEENREFTVISPVDGKRVQITADRELNSQEMAIMRHYATEKASMHKGKGNFKESTYGGTGILRHAGLTDSNAFKESKDSTRNENRAMAIDTALQAYVDKEIGHREAKLDKVFGKEAGKLEGKSYSEEKKKTASARAG
ncbi:hypothetical protein CC99x_005460 [Candidatus Berkiella cookevillensis]|uniref:Uncharacterized protein n=1 Tax=Candidatus Berkiella cookevillensis TaxID=437022 RepID=A0A0Q9YRK6_9GAMM|nr:hypothetical protein [Candidatus Berkiella cookevillensis]MCS5708349.1 hypothetical protein [Candidatus Berkiella cookevillensis]